MLKVLLSLAALAVPFAAQAQDSWQLSPAASGETLTLRGGPAPSFPRHASLEPLSNGLNRDICVRLTEERGRAVAEQPEWCHLSRAGKPLGWIAARALMPEGLPFVRGFRNATDACMLIGESATTIDFLDHSAWLVGCPDGHADIATYKAAGAAEMTRVSGYTLLSVRRP